MNITRSNQRERRLAANLGVPIEFEPRRRQDIDMIFVVADDARTARLLVPQLRFYSAGDIPTFATSESTIPATRGDNDLNGVIFADAPVTARAERERRRLAPRLASYWPQRAGP